METTNLSRLHPQSHSSPQPLVFHERSLVDFNSSFSHLNTLLLPHHHQTVPSKLTTHTTINTTTLNSSSSSSSSSFLSLVLGFLQENPITNPPNPRNHSSQNNLLPLMNSGTRRTPATATAASSTSLSIETHTNPTKPTSQKSKSPLFPSTSLSSIETPNPAKPTSQKCPNPNPSLSTQSNLKMQSKTLMKALSVFEKSMISAFA